MKTRRSLSECIFCSATVSADTLPLPPMSTHFTRIVRFICMQTCAANHVLRRNQNYLRTVTHKEQSFHFLEGGSLSCHDARFTPFLIAVRILFSLRCRRSMCLVVVRTRAPPGLADTSSSPTSRRADDFGR
jgi:hypothetical protein